MTNVYTYPCDEAVVRSAADTTPCSKSQGRWVLAATILGSSMAFVDGTVVNVALPVLQNDLDASIAQLQWIVESYALLLAALLLVGGMLGDQFGRRKIYGPTAMARAVKADQVPIARPRCASLKVALMMARLPGTSSAAPTSNRFDPPTVVGRLSESLTRNAMEPIMASAAIIW